ncbi:MAG: hypothetical protein HQP61_06245 [Peptococcaceae bacterium]|nr:hypothetical protein [Candidatus Syntrophopropionicum ammoniitolerans]
MSEKEKDKININANPLPTLEIEEFKNRMAHLRGGVALEKKKNKNK